MTKKDQEAMTELVKATFNLINAQKEVSKSTKAKEDLVILLEVDYVKQYLELLITMVLEHYGSSELEVSDDQRGDLVVENFSRLKHLIQESIALAFQDAMTKATKQDCDYFCHIKMINKTTSNYLN